MAEVYCGSEPCPLFLNSTCVFYTGESLLYIGVQNNDTLEAIIVKINQAFQNAGVGYAFTNGLIQPTPFQPVQLGGALTQNTTIGGNFTLAFTGNVQAARHITTGGSSSQFVKGDGTLDSTAYQPAANYITGLSGDATASGPGVAAMTLATVNFASGTFGNGNTIPIVTVNAKGLVTNITPVPVTIPPLPLTFIGDVVGSGFTGSNISMLLQNVNANPYNTITPLKFSVNGKGLVTSASPITASDIVNILGYYPGTSGTSGSDGTSGTSGTTGTSGSSGTSATSGTSGTTGTSGTSATSGTSGTSGTDGTGGTSGTSGSTGTSGTAGTSGTSATSGTSGTTGTSGSSGTSGSTGTSGTSGTTGTSGSSGTTGTSGSSGTSGTTGTSGSSGTTGTSGTDGTGGTSGSSGTTGSSGSSGTSGTSATSGSSGTSGSTGTSGSSGLSGDRFKTTSTTTYTLQAPGGTGTITVGLGLAYSVAQSIIIAYDANNHNEAEVTSYDPLTGSLSFIVFRLTGSGTYSVWSVNIDGASGGDGSSGSSGTSGTSATDGTSGTTGTSGSSGTSGTTGTSGSSGSSGTSAIDGTNGTSGTAGTTGTSGSSGTSGTTGTSGSSGTSGTSATNGTGGTSGTSGSSGSSGTTGTSGTSATSGTSGTSATSGTTGTSGTSGINGTGGTSGTSGSSATSGTSGTSGVNGAPGASGTSGTSGTSVAVSGTTNTMAKFTSATTIGNSIVTDNGSLVSIGGALTTTGNITANANLVVRSNTISGASGGVINLGGSSSDPSSLGNSGIIGLTWGLRGDSSPYYMVKSTSQAYGSYTYNRLDLSWHTGIIIGADPTYNGVRFYNNSLNVATGILFSVGDGDSAVRAISDMRAPIYYDLNNTGYYVDPASTSVLNIINLLGRINITNADIRSNPTSSWTGDPGAEGKIQYHANRWYIVSDSSSDRIVQFRRNGTDTSWIANDGTFNGSITGNATYSLNSTRLYATDNPYCYGCAAPYYMYMTYDGTRWFLQVSPATPSAVRVSYADVSGNTNSISSATGGAYTWTATNYFQSNLGSYSGVLSSPPLQAFATGSNSAFMSFHRSANYAVNMGLDADNVLRIGGWSASADRWVLDMSGNNWTAGSMRSPIFYDSDNTGYYGNFASTSVLNTLQFGTSTNNGRFTGDGTWGVRFYTDSGYIWFGPANAGHAHIYTDRPNFYLNAPLTVNGSSIINTSDIRSSVFYDVDNTGYYLDPTSSSSLRTVGDWRSDSAAWTGEFSGKIQYHSNHWYLQAAGLLIFRNSGGSNVFTVDQSGNTTTNGFVRVSGNTNLYLDYNYGQSIVGVYSSVRYQGVFAMGDAYKLPIDGTSAGNLYGIAWSYPSAGGAASNLNTHGALILENGAFLAALSGSIRARDDMRAPIFYDQNNTGYYLNPNGTSQLSYVLADDWFRPQGCTGVYWQSYGRGMWSPECEGNAYGNVTTYGTGRNGWQGWGIGSRHTFMSTGGDNVGVHDSGRGWIWYWNGSFTSFDFGYLQAAGSMRAPIFYDSNNTGYYVDAASTSVLHTLLNIGGWLEVRSNVASTNPTTESGLFFGWNKSGGNGEANIIVDGGANTGQFLFQRYDGGGSYTNIFQADIYGLTANSGTVNVFSDIRLKTNITNASPKLNDLMKLNVVNYEFVGEYNVLGKQLGFIAQEVEQIFPSLVREQDTRQYDDQGNYINGYQDTKILKVGMEFAMLVKAMQEQQSIIDSLKSEIETLKQK